MAAAAKTNGNKLKKAEKEDVKEHVRLRAPVVYEIVRKEGDTELARPASSLWWSGIAAGLCIGFSVVAEALLRTYLPDASWRPLVENLGYSVGFLIVILAREQLFTENTITAILPLMAERTSANLARVGRLWGIVFAANLAGALIFALFCTYTSAISEEVYGAMLDICRHMMENGRGEMFTRGIVAGWLIAALVWLMPSAEGAEFPMITLMTYLIAAGDFTHVIAGSVEAFLLVAESELGAARMFLDFTLPVLAGNVVGGTVLFALIAYAQVREEMA
ncbi:MAG: formate/nitrite transporter family protein [Pseudomonadota bacterium]|nr:formate/nitrite transporter family protein [Pseudomonadota bacterium]